MQRVTWPMVLLALAAGLSASGGELVVNGGFDSGTGGWVEKGSAPCLDTAWNPGGWVEISADCDTPVPGVGWHQRVDLAGSEYLVVSFRARSEAIDGNADAVLTFTGEAGATLWKTEVQQVAGTEGWRTREWALRAPEGAVRLDVFVGTTLIGSGRVAFDDVSVRSVPESGPRDVRVQCRSNEGAIRDLLQANGRPDENGNDFTTQLEATGISMLRLHDAGSALDISSIFPDPTADPDSPDAYRFGAVDAVLDGIEAAGIEPLVRLGEQWGGVPNPRMDPAKWARVVANVVRHVNGGWANGSHRGVRYWEIWNEPNSPFFWDGTPDAFYELYCDAALAIRGADPKARIGGPATAGYTSWTWMRGFLEAVKACGAPLDFFSWHTYHMGNPEHLADAQRVVRSLLDDEGFTSTEVFPDEWNLSTGMSCASRNCTAYVTSAYAAAHTASALIALEDTDAPHAFFFKLTGYEVFGLFGDGRTEPPYSPSGRAFLLLSAFREAPVRLAAEGSDLAGYAVLAGREREDGGRIVIVVSDPGSASTGYRLRLIDPPPRFSWRVEAVTDGMPCSPAACDPVLLAEGDQSAFDSGAMLVSMRSPAVHRITIEPISPAPRRPTGRAIGGPGGSGETTR